MTEVGENGKCVSRQTQYHGCVWRSEDVPSSLVSSAGGPSSFLSRSRSLSFSLSFSRSLSLSLSFVLSLSFSFSFSFSLSLCTARSQKGRFSFFSLSFSSRCDTSVQPSSDCSCELTGSKCVGLRELRIPTAAKPFGVAGGFFRSTCWSRSFVGLELSKGMFELVLNGEVERGRGLGTGEPV